MKKIAYLFWCLLSNVKQVGYFFQILWPSQKTWTLIGLTFGLIRDHYRNIFCRWTHHRRSTQNFFSFGSSVFVGALICMNETHIVWGSGLIIVLEGLKHHMSFQYSSCYYDCYSTTLDFSFFFIIFSFVYVVLKVGWFQKQIILYLQKFALATRVEVFRSILEKMRKI